MPHATHTGQREKIREILRYTAKPTSVRTIYMNLIMDRWEFTSTDPQDSIRTSLKRAPDMMTVGKDRWILCDFKYDQNVVISNLTKTQLKWRAFGKSS
jgi:predicted Zn-ribbon and HTH transcriptional regulator